MKKRLALPIGLFSLILFCSCNNTKNINSFIYYKVADECSSMGKIDGEIRQNPLVGDYTTEVTAIANDGYVFVKWSDGNLEATRSDISTSTLFVTYIAYFEVANE